MTFQVFVLCKAPDQCSATPVVGQLNFTKVWKQPFNKRVDIRAKQVLVCFSYLYSTY